VKDERNKFYIQHPHFLCDPDPIARPYHYYSLQVRIRDWKQFGFSDDIAYRIEKGSSIRIGELVFNVESVEINTDGSVKCFTGHVVEVMKTGEIKDNESAKNEVARIYKELVDIRDNVTSNQNKPFDIDATPVYPQPTKGWWQSFKDTFN
jgi:hypothetical protein